MNIFSISDLHLSKVNPKPMDKFGLNWINHWDKIKENWLKEANPSDIVLIPGDISWALTLEEAMPDILEIAQMPGKKIFVQGNHDYWWESAAKIRKAVPDSVDIIQNDFISIGEFNVCGSRGWMLPEDDRFESKDLKIYNRELIRLELSLSKAAQANEKPIIVMMHFPPFNDEGVISGFIDVMRKYNVKICVYGHLHGESLKNVTLGSHCGIDFYMVSCDYLDFKLKRIY
jgi:uncharacterized protein